MHFLLGTAVPVSQGWTHHLTHFGLSGNDRRVQKLHNYQLLQLEANCRSLGFVGSVLHLDTEGTPLHLGCCGLKILLETFCAGLHPRHFVEEAVYSLHPVLLTSCDVVALQAGCRHRFSLRHKTKRILWVTGQARSSSQEGEGH